jgi:hypothetical protein
MYGRQFIVSEKWKYDVWESEIKTAPIYKKVVERCPSCR